MSVGISACRATCFAVALALATSGARAEPPARADTSVDLERLKRRYAEGKAAFAAGEYEKARRIYLELWASNRSSELAANLGQAELSLGLYRDAAEHLAYAIRHGSFSQSAAARAYLRELFDAATANVGTLQISVAPEAASVALDGVPIDSSPAPIDHFVDPGTHSVVVTHPGYEPHRRTISVAKGETVTVPIVLAKLELRAPPAPRSSAAPVAPEPSSRPAASPQALRQQHAAMLMFGGTLVVAGVGAGATWIHAADAGEADADALAALSGTRGNCGPICQDLRDRAARDRTQGILSLSLAGLGALGATAYFLAYDEPASTERSLEPVILGGALALAGLGVGLFFWSEASERDQDARSQQDQLRDRGGTNRCGANGPDFALCAELFENQREADKNRGFAVTGLTLAGAAAAGTVAYWAWPRTNARAGIAIGGRNRIVTLTGNF